MTDLSPYDGILPALIKPVFKAACALRFSQPEVSELILQIVGAILEGPLRLLPAIRTNEEQTARRAKMASKAQQALAAEEAFVFHMRAVGLQLRDERGQKEHIRLATENGERTIVRLTPDALFRAPQQSAGDPATGLSTKHLQLQV
ncbi:hypothetical protein LTR35_017983 [Friedmanniomyces endolithicus]|uniref:Uncharacterized protein n=1 Tax=Friedmanniomyces endolithicus TaxID=329885 RepID=A0AAN6F4P8_9PEZI|nr:hypothetical protein LTR35_017983 [Friedmanniomyces endolithicus]KAK0267176.1 hypothetical protein LTS00_017853 [Friedmanniomyces endolithicus]KAK0302068.1 hypothetical protein LTR82_018007 [Friedmanniomyces endolithicus]KAK0969849.1 hypothetical protein LTR54_018050 [Friedmanniomyces endolithicus]